MGRGALTAAWLAAGLMAAFVCETSRASTSTNTEQPEDSIPATFVLSDDGAEIRLAGDFSEGTARQLRGLLRAHRSVRALALSSDGGLVDEAEQVGDLVAARGLVTIVRSACISACTLAFVRGRERLALAGAKLGFHAPWVSGEGGREEQVPSDEEKQAYLAAGIASDFVAEALAVPSSSIWFPDETRLVRAGVATAIVTGDQLARRLADPAWSGRVAAAE